MNDRAGDAILLSLMVLLPLSALLARRIPLKTSVKMAIAWVAVFVVGMLIVNQRDRYEPMLSGLSDAVAGQDQIVSGSTVRLRMADDGHFWAIVSINGIRRRMLVDSGATTTALSSATAAAAGIATDQSIFPVMIDTANGTVVARSATAARFDLSSINANGLPVVVSPAFGDTDVIGMNFLSRLQSWRVEGHFLILQPKAA